MRAPVAFVLALCCLLLSAPTLADPVRLVLASAQLRRLKPVPRSVVVQLEMPGRFERTPLSDTGKDPRWDFPIVVDTEFVRGLPYVDFALFDVSDPAKERLIAGARVKPKDLLRPGKRRLSLGRAVLQYVVIPPPRAPKPGRLSKRKGSADAYSLEQVFDAHADEINACANSHPDARGEVVLLFSISQSGDPLGVVVEKADATTKDIAACMRAKALKWSFPPPGGPLTVRYPLRLGPN